MTLRFRQVLSVLDHPWICRGIAGTILVAYFIICSTTAAVKGDCFDEGFFLTSGMNIWLHNDYHVMPEGGNLYQRVATLPLALGGFDFPNANDPGWPSFGPFTLGDKFFFEMENDLAAVLWWGRLPSVLCGMLFGWIVFCWARTLWGGWAGVIALLLYSFSPTILAGSTVATADLFTSGMMLLSLGAFWKLLHRTTITWLFASCLTFGCVFGTKFSFVAIFPVFLFLVVLRFCSSDPIQIYFRGVKYVSSRSRRVLLLTLLCLAHAASAFVMLWALFGFSYEDPNPQIPLGARYPTEVDRYKNAEGAVPALVSFCHEYQLIPEACLYGVSVQYNATRKRASFLMGEYSHTGFWYFFPLTFLIKTPVAWLLVIASAICAACLRWHRCSKSSRFNGASRVWCDLYSTAPLWALLIVYWIMAVTSKINIGHRHLMPIYRNRSRSYVQ